jgi:hypothetical protein
VSSGCGRDDCGLNPGDRFCMTCGRAAAEVGAARADTEANVEAAQSLADAPALGSVVRNGGESPPAAAAPALPGLDPGAAALREAVYAARARRTGAGGRRR